MKKNFTLVFIFLFYFTLFSQVGINNSNPQGIFHVDAAGNNPTDGTAPSKAEQADDFVISSTGVVGIGTTDPSPYSALEIESNKGLRLPQLSADQISALDQIPSRTTDKNGLMLYNSSTNCINYWGKTKWISLCKCTPASGKIEIYGPDPSPAAVNTPESFIALGGSNITRYEWKVNGNIIASSSDMQLLYTPTTPGTLTITVTGYGCRNSSTTTSLDIEVKNL